MPHISSKRLPAFFLLALVLQAGTPVAQNPSFNQPDFLKAPTWTSDNGNGTFTNPLFFDEFSDPDMIRVGDEYYLTGTTMHTMPGLPVLHSRDLVNWEFLCYAVDRLDLGPDFRLENGGTIYGQGIWAPCFRYHNGKYYIFSNVNKHNTQLFTATNPKGPWQHTEMTRSFHDLSVLFDDDGKTYVVWGYDEVHLAQLNDSLTGIQTGSEQVIVPRGSGAGEGSHFYKINGKYYITNTNYDPVCYQVCLRADNPRGPYQITVMSAKESLAIGTGWRLADQRNGPPFKLAPPDENHVGAIPMHQGGIIQVQSGEWWGWSMMDHNSIGRLVCLSPVTWQDGWPYFGLSGNLTRSPQTWIKPNTGFVSPPHAPYRRSDDFSSAELQPIWQWNHVPVNTKWSLKARKGWLRLNALPATDFWMAKNTLTQRAIGPESTVSTEAECTKLKDGDVAGLALLNLPYAWIGVAKKANGFEVQQFDQQTGKLVTAAWSGTHLWLRASCNFETEKALFSYSTDGINYTRLGDPFTMVFQLRTFQGVRYSLFNYNMLNTEGGYADFNSFIVDEPRPHGLTKPIPYGKLIALTSLADSTVLVNWKGFVRPVAANDKLAQGNNRLFRVIDKGNGRVALQSEANKGWVTVKGIGTMAEIRIEKEENGEASQFQWEDMLRGDLMLMSLYTHKYLFADPNAKSLCSADAPGTRPDRKDGACFSWTVIELAFPATAISAQSMQYPPAAQVAHDFKALVQKPKTGFNPSTKRITTDSVLIERGFIDADKKEKIPFVIYKPLNAGKKRWPVVICLHGTGGNKDEAPIKDILYRLTKTGIMGIAIDARYHGERVAGGARDSKAYVEAITRAWKNTDTAHQEHPFFFDTVNDIWTLTDYLTSRPDVDADRIGMTGISMGGIETWMAASIDSRIKVVVPIIGVQSFQWSLSNDRWQGRAHTIWAAHRQAAADLGDTSVNKQNVKAFWDKLLPGITGEFDCPSMLRLFAPRPLLILNNEKDQNCPLPGAQIAFASAKKAYESKGAIDKLEMVISPNEPHRLLPEHVKRMLAFFSKWL